VSFDSTTLGHTVNTKWTRWTKTNKQDEVHL